MTGLNIVRRRSKVVIPDSGWDKCVLEKGVGIVNMYECWQTHDYG